MKTFINLIYLIAIGISLSIVYLVSLPDTKYTIFGIIFCSFYLLSTGLMLENKMDKYLYVFISIICFMIIAICIYRESESNTIYNQQTSIGHSCDYTACPMKDKIVFESCGLCDEGSDCYYLDMTHFHHPTWNYDQCEEYLFSTDEKDNI